jgi:hypothetical protein
MRFLYRCLRSLSGVIGIKVSGSMTRMLDMGLVLQFLWMGRCTKESGKMMSHMAMDA